MDYEPKKIEEKWQKRWLDEKVFAAPEKSKKNKYYQLETFPYPSAAGLHVGHPKGYIAEDIHARFMRMHGKEVLYTMGWDAFGLPTENYAIKVGKNPKEVAAENIQNFKRQVQMFGFSYDWDREINTADPEYYKWTQWLFIQLFKKGLAYRKKAKVNWCPLDQTVLANEQVIDGKCERCDSSVEQREMDQWFFKITDYTERLLDDLEKLDWPEATIKRQKDWVGRSVGSEIDFPIAGSSGVVTVFTTRPDTLFGATYMVLAPEHPFISSLRGSISNTSEVDAYIEATKKKTELMRQEGADEKTGVELKGVKAINPATKEEIPIWIADYVLMGYGTGAIMAVSAHDERDFAFAKQHDLQKRKVIEPKELLSIPRNAEDLAAGASSSIKIKSDCWSEEGTLVNSGQFDGMDSEKAREEITKFVKGKEKTQYKLRDWLVSRQRYWGAPIPMVHCEACGIVPVPEDQLPVVLPDDVDFRPKGKPPLASSEDFMDVMCPTCKIPARRDPETLDTFVDSSWYFFRYTDSKNKTVFADKKKLAHWMPIDLYVIGAEHTVLHLLYSRFITKFLQDEGYIKFTEPFQKLRHQGMILGADGQKMSKSKGNVVNPDEIVEQYGVDTVRLYEMFMGPFADGQPWDSKGVIGIERFLKRAWRALSVEVAKDTPEVEKLLHKTIKKVTEDVEGLHFNTAVSTLMILINGIQDGLSKKNREVALKLFHPFAPHMAQELWSGLGHDTYLDFEKWPTYNEKLARDEEINLIVQVNGKLRATIKVSADTSQVEAESQVLAQEKIQAALGGKKPKKVVFVKGRLINFVL